MVASRLKKWAEALETGQWACREAGKDGSLNKPVDRTEFDFRLSGLFPKISRAVAA